MNATPVDFNAWATRTLEAGRADVAMGADLPAGGFAVVLLGAEDGPPLRRSTIRATMVEAGKRLRALRPEVKRARVTSAGGGGWIAGLQASPLRSDATGELVGMLVHVPRPLDGMLPLWVPVTHRGAWGGRIVVRVAALTGRLQQRTICCGATGQTWWPVRRGAPDWTAGRPLNEWVNEWNCDVTKVETPDGEKVPARVLLTPRDGFRAVLRRGE